MKVLAVMLFPAAGPYVQMYERPLRNMLSQQFEGTLEIYMQSGEPYRGTPYDRVALKYERARHVALEGGFDAMWTIEYDMIVPKNALQRLSQIDTDIAYGLYCWRYPPYKWSAYTYLDSQNGISLSEMPDYARKVSGKVIDVAGMGNGCTLIRRSALEKIPFRRAGHGAQDWYLSLDAHHLGLGQKCDTSLICGHMSTTPRPFIVWPDAKYLHLYRMEYQEK